MIKDYWEDYTTRDKSGAIFSFLRSRTAGVWHVLGKERQVYWKRLWFDIKHTTKDFEQMRNDLFEEYISALKTTDCKAKVTKLFVVLNFLGTKEDWEKFSRKEIIV